jgi:hypothetical protein
MVQGAPLLAGQGVPGGAPGSGEGTWSLFVAGMMALVMVRHRMNQAEYDSLHLIGIEKDEAGHHGAHAPSPRAT